MKELECPCCGKTKVGEYDICSVCGWENDPVQLKFPNVQGANKMTLNEAKEIYLQGKQVN